ncbi:S-adenosylmethionine mitochondrial carrier protein-like isoform X1 [Anneissia japonica]|uniref:S-adenosylmethionine mitochondrial carrier protein-like isoform X1 n=1 Tax=Anneissia japonica TaxID=1529436 RepID=UPI0014258CEA|nr:S-adenosylmethionine mitochondrial carrier protein-like isoform X1 [Anneissia japonica]
MSGSDTKPGFLISLVSGGCAGMSVDLALFPLDTVKTRLQSTDGFLRSGGFRGIYSGLLPVLLGSAPTAGVFFCAYELSKELGAGYISNSYMPFVHMGAASVGETAACLVRNPVEVIKQRAQTSRHRSSIAILGSTIRTEGFRGLYRGYLSLLLREIPFSFIQFPIWEFFKRIWCDRQGCAVSAWQSAMCGATAGGISAAITTPLDVAKTRIMLAKQGSKTAGGNIIYVIGDIWQTNGIKGLFAGVVPRVMWITFGGAIFFGAYEKVKIILISTKGRNL